jgi:transposase
VPEKVSDTGESKGILMSKQHVGSTKVSKRRIVELMRKGHQAATAHALNEWWARKLGGNVHAYSVRELLMDYGIILVSLPNGEGYKYQPSRTTAE